MKLKLDFSFSEVGIFLLCSYPFSLKVIWSPIIDTYYIKSLGQRRSWAISSQLVVSGLLFFLSVNINELILSKKIYELTFLCLCIVFFIATQDIAIDGWATTLCGKDNCSLASSCQTIGQIIGIIFSTSVFINLNNENFCKKFFNTTEGPLIHMNSYILILSFLWFFASLILLFVPEKPFQSFLTKTQREKFNSETEEEEHLTITETFQKIRNSFKNKNLKSFIGILLLSKIGLIFTLKISSLILIEKGFSRQRLTNLSSLITIVEIIISIKLKNIQENFLKVYLNSYRNFFYVMGFEIFILIAYEYQKEKIEEFSFVFFVIFGVFVVIKSYFYLLCFISMCGFFNRITDRSIGATYVTALNSASNLSEKWPGIFVFYLVDYLDYKIIGVFSIIYSIGFYLKFKEKLIQYDESDEKDWKAVSEEGKSKLI
jgi:hypothetical protein